MKDIKAMKKRGFSMKIIAGNWKMNGSFQNLQQMIKDLSDIDTQNTVILAVPYTMLCTDSGKISLSAQDISAHTHGAYTGEVSASMVASTGAKYTIIGHSECRQYHGDTNASVCTKAELAISNGLIPIICIGETMEETLQRELLEEIGINVKLEDIVWNNFFQCLVNEKIHVLRDRGPHCADDGAELPALRLPQPFRACWPKRYLYHDPAHPGFQA